MGAATPRAQRGLAPSGQWRVRVAVFAGDSTIPEAKLRAASVAPLEATRSAGQKPASSACPDKNRD
eukprot:2493499-Pyramimonas_sp.AAC.1